MSRSNAGRIIPRWWRAGLFGLLGTVASSSFASLPEKTSAVSPAEQVQFQQKTIEAQMQELQERMFHLADLTRDSEPDDSARLLMAVRKAREDLILEQMRDAIDRLSHQDLGSAADEQTQILIKLEELKKLLTSTDLDLQMQLERLRKLNDALAKLDAGIKEQKRQTKQSGDLAKLAKAAPGQLAEPRQQQQQNRKATEAVAQTVKDLGSGVAKAGAALGGACQSMSLAEGHLGGGRPGDAAGMQQQAVDQMQNARDQLEKERQKILEELERQVRKQVVENLTEMLDRQKNVRGATDAVAGHLPSGDRQTELRVKQLAPTEAGIVRICDQTIELIEQTEFSIALPPALKEIRASMVVVSDQLQGGVADAPLVTREKQIEQDLADLLETFKQLAQQPGPPGQCRGCKGNKNKLLAELKVLRMLQGRVNTATVAADRERAPSTSANLAAEVQSRIGGIADRQEDVRAAAERIHEELSGGN